MGGSGNGQVNVAKELGGGGGGVLIAVPKHAPKWGALWATPAHGLPNTVSFSLLPSLNSISSLITPNLQIIKYIYYIIKCPFSPPLPMLFTNLSSNQQ